MFNFKKKTEYYNADELLSRHYIFNMICGDRYGGKTTCIQKYAIKRAIQGKGEFAVLVRYDKDIKLLCETYFNNTMLMFYPDFEIYYAEKKFFLRVKGTEDKGKLVGYAFALNQATKLKSTSYPFIRTIIFEEFMNLEGKYIKSSNAPDLEVELLISLYQSIARGNGHQVREDVRVFLISNNYYLNNPYFRYFGIISDVVKDPFKRFYEKKTAPKCIVEMTHNDVKQDIARDDIHKGSKFIDLQNDLRYVKNITPKELICQLSFDNREFLNLAMYNDSAVVWSNGSKIRPDTLVYSCSPIAKKGIYNIKSLKTDQLYKVLVDEFRKNHLYYDKLETYTLLYNILTFNGL